MRCLDSFRPAEGLIRSKSSLHAFLFSLRSTPYIPTVQLRGPYSPLHALSLPPAGAQVGMGGLHMPAIYVRPASCEPCALRVSAARGAWMFVSTRSTTPQTPHAGPGCWGTHTRKIPGALYGVLRRTAVNPFNPKSPTYTGSYKYTPDAGAETAQPFHPVSTQHTSGTNTHMSPLFSLVPTMLDSTRS